MRTYPIPEILSGTHDGEEWALAAILGDRVVALLYIADIAPALKLDATSIKEWTLTDPTDLLELQLLGAVSVGIVNVDGFTEMWQTV